MPMLNRIFTSLFIYVVSVAQKATNELHDFLISLIVKMILKTLKITITQKRTMQFQCLKSFY